MMYIQWSLYVRVAGLSNGDAIIKFAAQNGRFGVESSGAKSIKRKFELINFGELFTKTPSARN